LSPGPGFIKCDVEGHELACVKGAIRVIRRSRPAWLIEVSGNPDEWTSTAYQVFKLLGEAGYEAYWFDGKRVAKRYAGDQSINYFFLRVEHLVSLQGSGLLWSG
jgi:hypothetical protein